MRVLLLSDIHANLPALEAVLGAAGAVDALWCLGDVVGYGPHPNECVELLRARGHVGTAGNHDWAALGKLDLAEFNPAAREAARWTAAQLKPFAREYLLKRPLMLEEDGYTLAHGSPRDPIREYLLSTSAARACFPLFGTPACFIGHSHVPLLFWDRAGEVGGRRLAEEKLVLEELGRVIYNPGSVGQPRDGDPRASFALLDTERGEIELRRLAYDLQRTQEDIRAAGLPPVLADRLALGR